MIDFRYHLVSIVAVFLALAIGIVVGSTALKPAVLTGLQKTATAEKGRIDALFAKNAQLNNQLKAAESYAQSGRAPGAGRPAGRAARGPGHRAGLPGRGGHRGHVGARPWPVRP